MVDKGSSVPMYLQIQHYIMEEIQAGNLMPGAQVPSEFELADQFNVSRMTARKSLDNLTTKGVLYRRKGKGTYVAENVMSYGLSTMLSFSQILHAQGHHVETKVLLTDVIPTPEKMRSLLQLQNESQVIIIRRLRLVEGRPAALHTSLLSYRIFSPILQADLSSVSLLDTIRAISGTQIAYTKDTVHAGLVAAEDANLLDIELGSPVLQVEGVAYSENGHPMRFTRGIYPGNLFNFVLTSTVEQAAALRLATIPKES